MPPASDKAFDAFFRARYEDLVRFVMRLGADLHDAEEVSQDAMSAAYERWDDIRDPPAWTWRVACRAYLRRRQRRRRHEMLLPAALLPEAAPGSRAGEPPEDDVISSDTVRRLLRGLARQQRRVVAWWLEGYRFEEIAQRLDIATSTARSVFRNARERLATRFGELREEARELRQVARAQPRRRGRRGGTR